MLPPESSYFVLLEIPAGDNWCLRDKNKFLCGKTCLNGDDVALTEVTKHIDDVAYG